MKHLYMLRTCRFVTYLREFIDEEDRKCGSQSSSKPSLRGIFGTGREEIQIIDNLINLKICHKNLETF